MSHPEEEKWRRSPGASDGEGEVEVGVEAWVVVEDVEEAEDVGVVEELVMVEESRLLLDGEDDEGEEDEGAVLGPERAFRDLSA